MKLKRMPAILVTAAMLMMTSAVVTAPTAQASTMYVGAEVPTWLGTVDLHWSVDVGSAYGTGNPGEGTQSCGSDSGWLSYLPSEIYSVVMDVLWWLGYNPFSCQIQF